MNQGIGAYTASVTSFPSLSLRKHCSKQSWHDCTSINIHFVKCFIEVHAYYQRLVEHHPKRGFITKV